MLSFSVEKNIKKLFSGCVFEKTIQNEMTMPKIYVGLTQKQIEMLEKICAKRGLGKIQELIRFLVNNLIEEELKGEKEGGNQS